ncbi:MAG: hypothetical protein IKH64_10190 [Prevotella sp.]|nr:hypothetical protein [Prevotella sp.]
MKKLLTIVFLVLGIELFSFAHQPFNHNTETNDLCFNLSDDIEMDLMNSEFICIVCAGINTLPGDIINGEIFWECEHCGQWLLVTFSGGRVVKVEVV